MANIYIVTSGSYSDYRINAVFDSRERADAYVAYMQAHKRGYDVGVEEWELNELSDPISRGLTCYHVWFMDIKQSNATAYAYDPEADDDGYIQNRSQNILSYRTVVWAQDEAAALKIANERRVRYIVDHNL